MLAAFRTGLTLKAIGKEHGITRERVRQILTTLPPDERRTVRTARLHDALRAREADRLKPYLDRPVPCTMCRQTILRGTPWTKQHPTCSQRCHQAFVMARWYVSAEVAQEHRRAQAKTILRRSDYYGDTRTNHAQRVLAGEVRRRGPNRHPKDSQARRVAREFGFLPAEPRADSA